MKTWVSYTVALALSLVLVDGPLLEVAYALQRTSLSISAPAVRVNAGTHNSGIARSSAPFISKLLSKRPAQDSNTDSRIPGQTITTLPDGRLLKTGGLEQQGPVSTVTIEDAGIAAASVESIRLQRSRAFHTATMLPDGKVLILGGIGGDGRVADTAEIFDPETNTSELLGDLSTKSAITNPQSAIVPRVYHTATLLTEGVVLIAGGVSSEGEPLKTAELWDFRTRRVVTRLKLHTHRYNHTATLMPDGKVLLSQGSGKDNKPLASGELFDCGSRGFSKVKAGQVEALLAAAQSEAIDPKLTGSIPSDGTTGVAADALLALRFSTLLRAETVSVETVALSNSYGRVETKVIPAENGRLAFVTPNALLLPATAYTLSLTGCADSTGRALPPISLSFTTAAAAAAGASVEGEQWSPDADYLTSNGRGEQSDPSWEKLPSLQAPATVTALAGQVLKLNGQPLANITIQIDEVSARTDDTGRFLLQGVKAGHRVMMIHGHTASKPGKTYGMFEVGVDIKDGKTNSLPYTIWMPVIDNQHATRLSVPTSSKVIARTPLIPDLEVHIPERVRLRNVEGDMTSFSITPIRPDRPPFPGPKGANVYFALQTHGARVESVDGNSGARVEIIFPNLAGAAPGSTIDLFSYSALTGWHLYGQGEVTKNGKQIKPLPGTTPQSLSCVWAALSGSTEAPAEGPPPGEPASDGDPVDLATGLLLLTQADLSLPDVLPIGITRTYRPKDTRSRPFGVGATHPYQMFIVGDGTAFSYVELILADGGRVRYNRVSSGTDLAGAVLEHTASPTGFYKSRLTWNPNYGWNLQFKDGSLWKFYSFDLGPALISMSDRFGNTVTIDRASYRRINRVMSPNGRWIEFTYDSSDRITQAKDNIGRTVNYTYDAGGRLWKVTDPLGGVTEYTYDSSHRMLTIKDARGIVYLTTEYDANGRVSRQTSVDGGAFQFNYILDANGKVTRTDVTDPKGNVRAVTFNSSGSVLTDTRGCCGGQSNTFERQAGTNFLLSVTDPLGRRTEYTYDSSGNTVGITYAAGTANAVTASFTYEPVFNRLATATDPLNHTMSFSYDSKGSLIGTTDPLGHQSSVAYNPAGQPISATDALGNTVQLAYDSGDFTTETDPLGHSVTGFTDAAGRKRSIADSLGRTTRYEYDALSRPTVITDPLQGATSYVYDANGNLLSVTDARGKVHSYTYDNMDRMATHTDPLSRVESYQYDFAANLTQYTDRKGQITTCTYDSLDRMTQMTYQDGSTITYAYDGVSRLTQVVDSISGTITYAYDDFDRMTSKSTPQGTVSYAYDASGRRTGMTVPGQAAINYTYDNADRLTQITQGASTVVIAYDSADRRTSLTLPNGVVTEYSYDSASDLTALTYKKSGVTIGDLSYEYDAAGKATRLGGSFARTGLPPALTTTSYTSANEQTAFGSQTLAYDNNGNLTNDGVNSYTWNVRNQLAGISGPGLAVSFAYDASGKRTSKTVNGVATTYLYDGANIVQEQTGGSSSANMLNGELDEVLVRTDSSGALSPIGDGLGSVVALTDSAGTVQTSYAYEPFGKTTAVGAASSNPTKYTGREDDGTGLYYYRARYYAPSLQRFISEDPIGFSGGLNFYAYVENDPVNGVDPYGLKTYVCCRRLLKKIRILFWKTSVPLANHCYILVTPGNDGPNASGTNGAKYGLHDKTDSGRFHKPEPDYSDDRVSDGKKDCTEAPGGIGKERKIASASNDPKNCKGCGSNYKVPNGPNSNTYVSDVLEAVGLKAPDIPQIAPGYRGEGWFRQFLEKWLLRH
jgi:RHS repeat-associated protein